MASINLLQKYGKNNNPVNLLKQYSNNEPQEQFLYEENENPMELARNQIEKQYPNIPNWLREGLLSISPKEKSPLLEKTANAAENVTSAIPDVAGAVLQGASLPIRGISSFIPNEYAQRLANSPDLTNLLPRHEGAAYDVARFGGEAIGAGGLLGKIFKGAKAATQATKLPSALQNATALGTTGAIATPGGTEEKIEGALGALALGGAGKGLGKVGKKLPQLIKGLFSEVNPESAVNAVQKPYDKMLSNADELYGQVKSAIGKRKIKLPVNEVYLDEAYEILPKTRANRELINKAKSGDYNSVHDLQSHLFKKGTKGLSSDDIALENQGEEILELRNKINDELENNLIKGGNLDVVHVLSQGKKQYAKLMDTYFNKNLRKSIGKMVHHETRLVPKNPLKMFEENSVPMKSFLEKHPEVSKQIENAKNKEEAMNAIKKILIGTGVGGGTLAGGKTIYDIFK